MTSAPAWSMGTSKRDADLKSASNSIPGPGTYNAANSMKQTTPYWRIGTSTRREEKRSNTPGPGCYDPEKSIHKVAPKYSIGGKIVMTERRDSPGPGAYEATTIIPAKYKAQPSYSMRGRSVDHTKNTIDSPGPAAYDQPANARGNNSARVKFGSSTRDQFYLAHFTPGPGAYQIKKAGTFDARTGPKWGFGTGVRKELNATFHGVPGPGAYTMNTSFDEHTKGPVILSRRPDSALLNASFIPGPGTYNIADIGKRAPTYRIGSSARSSSLDKPNDIPGPGVYDPKLYGKGFTTTMGTSLRPPLDEREATPGPGTYGWSLSTNYGPKYGMVPRRKPDNTFEGDKTLPGPGAYDINISVLKKAEPKFGVGTATRDGFYRAGAIPGPGSYDVRGRLTGPKWRFGSEGRSKSMTFIEGPGPGAYNIPAKFAIVPKYALASSNTTMTLI